MSTNKMADDDANTSEPKDEKCISFKYTTFCSDIGGSDNNVEGNISLQEAFRRYREAKQDELRQARMLRKRQELRKADPQKMATLRQKFLNQAKRYYGYPYARKYWPPDSPEYKSKLFLDCCGLVRRVMRDLAEDFGFIIGPWNQAYMFDTLPIKVEREEDMKPGDLVFISATYYNPKSKKQRHNMTHVEIWAGEGNKTIGARWNNGKVQMFDHYKFLAKSYHSETYHLRSIDTWLKGICTSHCSQHSWRRSKYSPSKKSIFSLPEQAEEDEAAGDDNDNIDNFAVRGNTFIDEVAGISKMVEECKLAEAQRPKTDMDLRHVHSDSSLSMAKSHVEQTNFPVIKNNLGERGKGVLGRRKKGRKEFTSRENDDGDRNEGDLVVNDTNEGAAAAYKSDTDKAELTESNKPLGQLSISGSLTDLGKKGFYLKDLVDSQKQENLSNERENDNESGDDSDDEYLSNGSEEDFDDDYFIFVKDENASDVEDEKVGDASETVSETKDVEGEIKDDIENCELVSEEGDKDEQSRDSKCVEGRKDDGRVQDESHDVVIVGNDESCAQNEKSANDMNNDICRTELDGVRLDESSSSKCKDELEGLNEHERGAEGCENPVVQDNLRSDGMSNECKIHHTDLTMTDVGEKVVIDTDGQIGATAAGSVVEPLDSCCHGNTNENANPKTTEQTQSNKQDKTKHECIKASVVTLVSQVSQTSRPHTESMQTPVLPVESSSSINLPALSGATQSWGSNSGGDTEYRLKTNSSTGAK